MPYVITEKCLGEQYANCASVCPVDCIRPTDYQGAPFMVILPDPCIDCGLCLPECPVGAIVESTDDSPEWAAINQSLAELAADNPPVEARNPTDPPRRPGNTLVPR